MSARWPYQPLEELLAGRGEPVTDKAVAAALGCQVRQMWGWRHAGTMTGRAADKAACALGLHPALVWDGWYADEPGLVAS